MDFTKVMSDKNDNELINVVYLEAFNYSEEALVAAELELKSRMNLTIENSIKKSCINYK